MGLKEKVQEVRDFLKDYPNVKLIAATKYMTLEGTKELIDAGTRAASGSSSIA